MTVEVKICGLKQQKHVDVALAAGAKWVGFVFYDASPRNVSARDIGTMLRRVGPAAQHCAVGLFVKPTDQFIESVLDEAPLSILQIYDTPQRALEIRQRFQRPVWLSIPVKSAADLPRAPICDGFVMEAAPPDRSDRPGGNGQTFDWTQLHAWQAPSPWLLAGGLTPENIANAIKVTGAPAVDVSSGVETQPGIKSLTRITRFIKAAHASCA